jgi:hypothetical protein
VSLSPVHPDPACPDCHGTGRAPFPFDDPKPAFVSEIPCGRCKARECPGCDAVLPAHEPGCANHLRVLDVVAAPSGVAFWICPTHAYVGAAPCQHPIHATRHAALEHETVPYGDCAPGGGCLPSCEVCELETLRAIVDATRAYVAAIDADRARHGMTLANVADDPHAHPWVAAERALREALSRHGGP